MVKLSYVAVLQDHPEQFFDINDEPRQRGVRVIELQTKAEAVVRNLGITSPRKDPITVPVRIQQLIIKNGKLERTTGTTYNVQPPLERMTDDEYNEEMAEILKSIPPDFHQFINTQAYERGHSSSHEECVNIARSLASDLLPCINKFAELFRSN